MLIQHELEVLRSSLLIDDEIEEMEGQLTEDERVHQAKTIV
jgi:hypothetical protein